MFGYIRVLDGELKVKELGLYRGIYCGLCKTMKNNTGITSPLTLTYDFVLLAILRSEVNNEGFSVVPGRCIVHPIKKRPIAKENTALTYCSAVSAILTYYKLLDDKTDADVKRRIIVKTTIRQARRNMKKAIKAFPEFELTSLASNVSQCLEELAKLEQERSDSADICADVFGRLLAKCFSHNIDNTEKASHCYELGYRVGRWIYLADLCDDFKSDIKNGSFNPLICAGFDELPQTLLKGTLERERLLAYSELKKLDFKYSDLFSIAENILCFGMRSATEKIFKKYSASTDDDNNSER